MDMKKIGKQIAKLRKLNQFTQMGLADKLDDIAKKEFSKNGLNEMNALFPFLSNKCMEEIGKQSYDHKGISSLLSIVPFLKNEFLQELAEDALEKHGFSEIQPLLPFIDVDKLVKVIS